MSNVKEAQEMGDSEKHENSFHPKEKKPFLEQSSFADQQ